ncbi:nitrate oxidoreductase alpha subunit [Saccharicrinis carchari]|uniref:nitrate reductase (quinone) n=1 Tax=Saccharicrinis carchari TaxID=1168039 RepID=A0A521C5L5_SACCC|nr:nitrate reductase subunit alpha [Saccharicrinis carchari]SMO54712.1 nitrate oxidoreductase alpha subunit [Saccharicrinis carchari]
MSWIKDMISPKARNWEEFYRNRWQHDKIVRSTHGVNCTGGCSWNIHVKDGIVVWESQALDYPLLENSLPHYEPRGCQRGISFSWYLYSPVRVKYPMVRGALIDMFREEKEKAGDAMEAWKNIQQNPEKRKRYQKARGKGGFRRISWDEALEVIGVANIYTAKKYGPDRVVGFSPIPAMSMMSFAAGSRFLQLFGGVHLSFYDWYCDLPNSFPEIWGEQTDVGESADWYNAKFVAVMGANLGMTRTPDVHFFSESRHNGTKTVVFSPDFSMVAKYADQWVPLHAGQDGAFWMAVTHVILKEAHHENQVPYFIEYTKKYTDSPYLVELKQEDGNYTPGKLLRANRIDKYADIENGDWKFLNIDADTDEFICPPGSSGHRWQDKKGSWNLRYKDGETGEGYNPLLTLIDKNDEVLQVEFTHFEQNKKVKRGVPVRYLKTKKGKVAYTTVYDLIMGQYGVARGMAGDYPEDFTDTDRAYTPGWQEIFTGISGGTVLQFAREWCRTAEATRGKCMVIIGAGINHWYHSNLMYRAATMSLMLTGCIGVNGGGMNHYVGQEKLAPVDSWSAIMSGKDWKNPPRFQQSPIWHYMHSNQWRYDGNQADYNSVPKNDFSSQHSADLIAKSVRNGWMPFFPQYNKNTFDIAEEAKKAGATGDKGIQDYIIGQLKSGELKYSVNNPDAEENFPRVWYIWRGNALMSSAKGHEYFLKHYLGTHHNEIADEVAKEFVKEIEWKEEAPQGKMDLVVDLNFRMDTSALYSDIVLPAASWYEKADLNSTDMHSFIHPLAAAIPPVWESKTDWEIFREIARVTSEVAKVHLPGSTLDIVNVPINHDSRGEIAQTEIKDWMAGECEPVPGKTMHNIVRVERDYTQLYNKFTSLGDNVRNGLGAHGTSFNCEDYYDQLLANKPHVNTIGDRSYPSIKEDVQAIDAVLRLSSLTNGKLSERAYEAMEKNTGLNLSKLRPRNDESNCTYNDLLAQPRRLLNSPIWSGLMENGRAYSAYSLNIEHLVPWRTLTGRQHFYLDHDGYISFGEHLPTYKPSPRPEMYGDLRKTIKEGRAKLLNVLTPHGKWHIHSTYGDTLRMLTLSRGMEPCWLNEKDAEDLGVKDNDWVEVLNDNGVYCTRACVSSRIPPGICIVYHSPERTYSVPKSPSRGNRRAGGHNSLTRVHLKPNLLVGGYGQFTFGMNYWGPVGVNRDTFIYVQKMDEVKF